MKKITHKTTLKYTNNLNKERKQYKYYDHNKANKNIVKTRQYIKYVNIEKQTNDVTLTGAV